MKFTRREDFTSIHQVIGGKYITESNVYKILASNTPGEIDLQNIKDGSVGKIHSNHYGLIQQYWNLIELPENNYEIY